MEDVLLFKLAIWSGFPTAAGIALWMHRNNNTVPYGRHHKTSAAAISLPFTLVMLPTRLAWSLMESPPLLLTIPLFSCGCNASLPVPRILAALFFAHYFHRAVIYPLRMQPSRTRNLPLLIFLSALFFNVYNTYIQVRSISHYTDYPSSWLYAPQFALGTTLFIAGMILNIRADSTLMSLRRSSASNAKSDPLADGYKIPEGGLFAFVTCANYFGELIEWLGWAIATWSIAGLVFFVLCLSNLVPRAIAHHEWYVKKFPGYPRKRKILIPFCF